MYKMENKSIDISLCTDSKVTTLPCNDKINVEQVILIVCKQLNIGPLARHLFALRIFNTKTWLPLNSDLKNARYDFRIRYKVASLARLKKVDIKAYDYYFHQVRSDVLNSTIPDLVYEKVRSQLVGLGVADMYRFMLEKDISREAVENDYKKFFPREVLKQHKFFIKRPVRESLIRIRTTGQDAWYVKGEYLKQLDMIAPEYLSEEYSAWTTKEESQCRITLRISPYHSEYPGIRICYDSLKKEWTHLSTIEDLCAISIRDDGTVEISRKSGIPAYMKFDSTSIMQSFVSLLDGYYRLMVKWTFNICKEMATPTLCRLYALKCHGPVGGEFSYAKLEEKRQNKRGCFVLRECEVKYNVLYIDVCIKNCAKPKTYKLEILNEEEYIFHDDVTRYKSIAALITTYNKPDGHIYLHECLPPSEFDISPLLLCHWDTVSGDALTDADAVSSMCTGLPVCINPKDLQVFRGQKKDSSSGVSMVYRSMWKLAKGKKLEVALKVLKQNECDKYLKEFMDRAGNWSALGGTTGITRLWGVSLGSPPALVLEYAKLGALPQYLRDCRSGVLLPLKIDELLEATSQLASALWHLEEHGIVHGKIRCGKILVFSRDEKTINVKMTDCGIHTPYTSSDVHWIPVECYSNYENCRRSHAADVWAFATTVWEIFMHAQEGVFCKSDEAAVGYANGRRLAQPQGCPDDIYKILLECWDVDPHRRKKPQAILRDISQLLYSVFNSRRKHPYATIFAKAFSDTSSISSVYTDDTLVSQREELLSVNAAGEIECDVSVSSGFSGGSITTSWLHSDSQDFLNNENALSCTMSYITSNFNFVNTSSTDDINAIQTIFEVDNYNLVLQGRIGQGFYGEVYKGTLELLDGDARLVAVKKLKKSAVSSGIEDFEREITIMKTLKHPNIVEILTVLEEPEYSLIMEYVPHGSLQTYLKIHPERITTKQRLNYALDVALGMNYLSQKHIVHRDLAARNILVVDENHVKISDFGLAQVVGKNEYYILRTNRDLPIKWYAPESLRDGKFSTRSDVWSYGVTLFEMFSHGDEPNLVSDDDEGQQQQNLLDALESGKRFACPPACPPIVYIKIMHPCWEQLPSRRPTFSQLTIDIEELLSQQ